MLDPSLPISDFVEALEPEEVKYLRMVCRHLSAYDRVVHVHDDDFEPFDADELGIDPEEDL